jgi:hypothetical protein
MPLQYLACSGFSEAADTGPRQFEILSGILEYFVPSSGADSVPASHADKKRTERVGRMREIHVLGEGNGLLRLVVAKELFNAFGG